MSRRTRRHIVKRERMKKALEPAGVEDMAGEVGGACIVRSRSVGGVRSGVCVEE